MFKKLLDFLNVLPIWFQGIVTSRTSFGDSGEFVSPYTVTAGYRPWFAQAVGYKQNLYLVNLQTITDRTTLNKQVADRYLVQDVNSKQGVSALRIEIAQLYSFQKCFVARHKTRLQYYRDDLTQKAFRNMYAVQLSYDNFTHLQGNCDSPQ